MAVRQASVSLAAHPSLTCSVMSQRITVTPGNLQPDTLGVLAPLEGDPYVLVPGVIDGIYDT